MKKLTSLQILMLMGLALNSHTYSKEISVNTDALEKDAVRLILLSEKYDQAAMDVLHELAKQSQDEVEQLILDEEALEPELDKIISFLKKKLDEIKKLTNSIDLVSQVKVAKLAIETAHAQSDFEKAKSQLRMKHKEPSNLEQTASDLLEKTKQGVIKLNEKAKAYLEQAGDTISKNEYVQQASGAVSKGIKRVRQHAEKYLQSRSSKTARANDDGQTDSESDSDDDLMNNDDQMEYQFVASDDVAIQASASNTGSKTAPANKEKKTNKKKKGKKKKKK